MLTEPPGISEVYSVAGAHDLAAIIRVSTNEQLADLVTNEMLRLDGIRQTVTLIKFKSTAITTSSARSALAWTKRNKAVRLERRIPRFQSFARRAVPDAADRLDG